MCYKKIFIIVNRSLKKVIKELSMDYFRKIDELRIMRGWSFYKLSQESGLAQQTFTQWMNGTVPTLKALQAVCDAFDITLAQFFAEGEQVVTSVKEKELLTNWKYLSKEEKSSILAVMKNYNRKS